MKIITQSWAKPRSLCLSFSLGVIDRNLKADLKTEKAMSENMESEERKRQETCRNMLRGDDPQLINFNSPPRMVMNGISCGCCEGILPACFGTSIPVLKRHFPRYLLVWPMFHASWTITAVSIRSKLIYSRLFSWTFDVAGPIVT